MEDVEIHCLVSGLVQGVLYRDYVRRHARRPGVESVRKGYNTHMEAVFIQNRRGQRVAVAVDRADLQRGLVFLAHGLGGTKSSARLKLIAGAFVHKGFTAVRFDTTNTYGESDGAYELSTFTNYYEDLEDVIEWARSQQWFQEPFALAGLSFGGKSITLYAERHPERVFAVAPIATGISGEFRIEASNRRDPNRIRSWKESGWKEEKSSTFPGRIYRLPWSHMEDDLAYDTLKDARKLTMPVLLIVGEKDERTPPNHVRQLYDAIPDGRKELHVVKGMEHTFKEKFFPVVEKIILKWINTFT